MAKLIIEQVYDHSKKVNEIATHISDNLKKILPHVKISSPRERAPGERVVSIKASSHLSDSGDPKTVPGNRGHSHSGVNINLYYYKDHPKIVPEFYEMNSHEAGNGSKMVKHSIDAMAPHKNHLDEIQVHHDYTSGFWYKMSQRHNSIPWRTGHLNKPKTD